MKAPIFMGGAILLVISFAFRPCETNGAQPDFAKAEIYYYGWDVMTRGRLSLDDVRRNARIRTIIPDGFEAGSLERWLRVDLMRGSARGEVKAGDPRLVVDLWKFDGTRLTYYSDGALLFSEQGDVWRKVDRRFLQKFTFRPVR